MITIRPATFEDLDGIMKVEEKKWEEGTAATREVMRRRIEMCDEKFFFITEEEMAGKKKITGYLVMQPTNLTPETCISWNTATDNGTMEKTYEPDGVNLYIVSIGAISPPDASAETADRIIARIMDVWCQHGGIIMFTARMPGFSAVHEKTGISPEEYWQLKRTDGSPHDSQLHFYWSRIGNVFPYQLLKNGFPSDSRSGGHAVLFVVTDIQRGQECIQNHLCRAAYYEGKKEERRRKNETSQPHPDAKVALLDGGRRQWWDVTENDFVSMHTLYIPQRCDWRTCTFCAIPQGVTEYEKIFFNGERVPDTEIVSLFKQALEYQVDSYSNTHTLCLLNAGSFLSDVSNPPSVRKQIIDLVSQVSNLSRLIIETNANDVDDKKMHELCSKLEQRGINLTVRIGIETLHETLRLKYLKKGQSDKALRMAVRTIHKYGALAGGYVLLHPAPFSNIRALLGSPEETEEQILLWAEEEANSTIDFILGKKLQNLGMDEVYFCSTNVGPNTALTRAWEKGDFYPAPLNMVCRVLEHAILTYGPRIHMLPFKDERSFLAIPSNHVKKGIHQNLHDAEGCDTQVHAILEKYRQSMNPFYLTNYLCTCKR